MAEDNFAIATLNATQDKWVNKLSGWRWRLEVNRSQYLHDFHRHFSFSNFQKNKMNLIKTKKEILQFLETSKISDKAIASIYKIIVTQQPEGFITEHVIMNSEGRFNSYQEPLDRIVESYAY